MDKLGLSMHMVFSIQHSTYSKHSTLFITCYKLVTDGLNFNVIHCFALLSTMITFPSVAEESYITIVHISLRSTKYCKKQVYNQCRYSVFTNMHKIMSHADVSGTYEVDNDY